MEIKAPITLPQPIQITAPITWGYGAVPTLLLEVPPVNGVTVGILGQFASVGGTVLYQCTDTDPMTWELRGSGAAPVVAATPPVSPTPDMLWTDSTDGSLNQWDADQSVWVNLSHEVEAIAFVISVLGLAGDSITNGASGFLNLPDGKEIVAMLKVGAIGYAMNILGHPFSLARNEFSMNTPGYPDMDFGWDGINSTDYLSSETAISTFPIPDAYPGNTLTPCEVALASNSNAYVLHIGTNDLNTATAATALTRITALATALRSSNRRVWLCTLLPRLGNTAAPTVEPFQGRIDEVNAGLAAVATATGCTLVSWHEDLMSGGAQIESLFSDGVHPNAAGASVLGAQLAAALAGFVGPAFPIPAKGSANWITANPYMDVDTTPADGIADGFAAYYYTTAAHSLETIDGTVWQQTEEQAAATGIHEFFAPFANGASVIAAAGTEDLYRACCRYEVVEGDIGGVGLYCVIGDAGFTALRIASDVFPTVNTPPIAPHTGLFLTEPFTIPANSATGWTKVAFYGNGTIRMRQFGIFKV